VPSKLTPRAATLAGMSFAIALTDEQWELVADLYRPRVSGATFTRGDQPAKLPRANWFLADRQIALSSINGNATAGS